MKEDEWEVEAPLPQQLGPFAYKEDQWVGFDDEEMVFNKVRYHLQKHLITLTQRQTFYKRPKETYVRFKIWFYFCRLIALLF